MNSDKKNQIKSEIHATTVTIGEHHTAQIIHNAISVTAQSDALDKRINFHQTADKIFNNCVVNEVVSENKDNQFDIERLRKEVKDFYKSNATIKIPVFDLPQHVKDSYVNLAIVDKHLQNQLVHGELKNAIPAGRSGTLENENLSLLGRNQTYEDINKVKDPIDLEKLFDQHSRAIVIGRAGIGKSTFCKYIAYKWQNDASPSWPQFTMMYWIPLRYLANYSFKYDYAGIEELSSFIVHVIPKLMTPTQNTFVSFRVKPSEIQKQLELEGNSTLLVLDGYDEIKGFIEGNTQTQQRAKELFDYILRTFKNYLITSRPHAAEQDSFSTVSNNAYYELMGFTNPDIPNYVVKTFNLLNENKTENKLDATQAIGLLRKNPCVWGISHVPINLALICSVWDKSFIDEIETINMTQLYTAIIYRIYKINLSKIWNHGNNPYQQALDKKIHEDNDKDFTKFLKECQPLITFLEELAFHGMINNQLIFSQDHIEALFTDERKKKLYYLAKTRMNLDSPAESDMFPIRSIMDFICKLGLLSTLPDGVNGDAYYFIHLTFQEYFAASHLKFLWLNAQTHNLAVNDLRSFVNDARYEVVIWFLAGHIYRENKLGPEIDEFFSHLISLEKARLENNPTLLLLLCRCLEEITLDKIPKREQILTAADTLLQNILFHTHLQGYENLVHYRKTYVDALKFSPKLLKALKLKNKLKNLKESQEGPLWATVAYSELFADDPIGQLILIIDNNNKIINARKSAIEHLVALIEPSTIMTILPVLIRYLSNKEDELFLAAWAGIVQHKQNNNPSVIEELNKTLQRTLSINRILIALNVLVDLGEITKEVLVHCFENKASEFQDILKTIIQKNEEKFILACHEVVTGCDSAKNAVSKIKAALHLEKYSAVAAKEFDIMLYHCEEPILEKINSKDDAIFRVLEKIIAYCQDRNDIYNLNFAAYYYLFCKNRKDFILDTLKMLLKSGVIRYFLRDQIVKFSLDKNPFIAQEYYEYISKNKESLTETFYRSNWESPTSKLLKELQDPKLCVNAKAKLKDFINDTDIIIKACFSNIENESVIVSQVAAEILFENNNHNATIIDILIKNACGKNDLPSTIRAKLSIKNYTQLHENTYLFRSGYIAYLTDPSEAIASFSLENLLAIGDRLTEVEIDTINNCLETRSEELIDYTRKRISFDQLLFKMGKLNENKYFNKQIAQLDSLIPLVRLSASTILLKMEIKNETLACIKVTLLNLGNCADDEIRAKAISTLNLYAKKLITSADNDYLEVFEKDLNHNNYKVSYSAFQVLTILLSFNVTLEPGNYWEYKRLRSLDIISNVIIGYLYNRYLTHIMNNNTNHDEFYCMATLMYQRGKISTNEFLKIIEEIFADGNEEIIIFILEFLAEKLSDEAISGFFLKKLTPYLTSKNKKLEKAVADTMHIFITNQKCPPLAEFLNLLLSKDSTIRDCGISQLLAIKNPDFIYTHLRIFYCLFNSKFTGTIISILSWFDKLENIPLLIIKPLAFCLSNKDKKVRDFAYLLLKKHHLLNTDECLSFIISMLKVNDLAIRLRNYNTLISIMPVPKFADKQLPLICAVLKCNHNLTIVDLINWLAKAPSVPSDIIDTLHYCLGSKSELVRDAALSVLQHYKLMKDEKTISTLTHLLISDNIFIRKFAATTLMPQNNTKTFKKY